MQFNTSLTVLALDNNRVGETGAGEITKLQLKPVLASLEIFREDVVRSKYHLSRGGLREDYEDMLKEIERWM